MNALRDTRIAITVACAMVIAVFSSCHKSVRLHTDAISDRAAMPVLDAHEVNTLISDSGITRYRIQTPHWLMYDKANPPYWEFPDGIYLERFDEQLNINAWLESDYAFYNETEQTWLLRGNVHAKNLEGEQFDTPELNWSQRDARIFSDSNITITREASIIKGIGFESNQEMTQYTIHQPTGIFPIEE